MSGYNKAGEPEHTPLPPGRDKPLHARDVHAECRARITELEAELHIAEVWRVRAEQAEAELAASRGLLQSRFDQEKAAHESLQAERIAERENGRTWHREAVRLKAENERLTEKCANIPDTWGELLERAEQAEAEAERVAKAAARISEEKEQVENELAALKGRRCDDLLDELRELRTAESSMYKGMGITKAIRVVESWAACAEEGRDDAL